MSRKDEEISRLKAQLQKNNEEAGYNQRILKRAQERELELLRAQSMEALLDRLVNWLADSFKLPLVTLVLRDPQHELRHLLMSTSTPGHENPRVLFVDALRPFSRAFEGLRRPTLGPFDARTHATLFPSRNDLGSVAILPIRRSGRIAGSLNLGSPDPERFRSDLGTDFLSHLAEIASVCLENSVNRARLVLSGLTDVLTGWHNRRYLETRLQEELVRARRERSPLGCVMLDIDHFKAVNDDYGHLAGDKVLKDLTARVETLVRGSDVAARYGGEEFALLLPATRMDDAERLAERIRNAVAAEPFALGQGRSLAVTVSLGVAIALPGKDDSDLDKAAEDLIARGDAALYRAKNQGRNRVAVDVPEFAAPGSESASREIPSK